MTSKFVEGMQQAGGNLAQHGCGVGGFAVKPKKKPRDLEMTNCF